MRGWVLAALIGLAMLALRLPVMLRQHAAQDEDFFAAPGWTILSEGRPRIPYMPTRDRESHFYRADEGLFVLPPLYFYAQAAVYAVTGPSTGAGRIASGLAGVVAAVLLFALGRRLTGNEKVALAAAGVYAFSRCTYFPWLMCRPDALCGMWGFAALLAMLGRPDGIRRRDAAWTGLFTGLGLLTHPFATVYGVQCAVGLAIRSRGWRQRITSLLIFGACTAAALSLWLPLILRQPELFAHQFIRHIFGQQGPGLITRLVWPWPSLAVQWPIFLEHVGPLQAGLMLAGLAGAGLNAWRTGTTKALFWLSLSAVYLHVASVGTHATKGYWCYTGGLLWLATMSSLGSITATGRTEARPVAWWGLTAVVTLMLIPGSGLRTLAAHVKHWDDVNYDARRFATRLMELVPREGTVAVDPSYVFDFELARRRPVLGLEYAPFFRMSQQEVRTLVVGEYTASDLPALFEGKKVAELGDRNDPFACFAEVWVKE